MRQPGSDAETIAAIATGSGAIGIVRISGPASGSLARIICGRQLAPRQAHLVRFQDAQGGALDQGIAIFFRAPHSYTGEDMLECHTHGALPVMQAILSALLAGGARAARAGEFTERAFLNGKLDLTQAEAVADLIAARSEHAARAAQASLQGEFSRRVNQLTFAIDNIRAQLEASLDFSEEDITAATIATASAALQNTQQQIEDLLRRAENGIRLTEGLLAVLVGAPNAGKSSLFNALLGEERAIVTPVAGTTRDFLQAEITLDGVPVMLVDTAGLQISRDAIEQEGIRRAHEIIARADVIIALSAADQIDAADPLAGLSLAAGARVLPVISKSDLRPPATPASGLCVSAKTAAGIADLQAAISGTAAAENGSGAFSARRRHVEALTQTATHLQAAAGTLHQAPELAAEQLRFARVHLDVITGRTTTDDMLEHLFRQFCIGK